jgi:hypothetical protein
MAEAERREGRLASSIELAACAASLEARSAREPVYRQALVEAGKKRRGGPRRAKDRDEVHMPGALPAEARRAVSREVAAIFDAAGEKVFKATLEKFQQAFAESWTAGEEGLKTQLKEQYGAAGLAQHLPFMGEFRSSVLANLFEYGAGELMKMERYSPAGAPGALTPPPPAPATETAQSGAPTLPRGASVEGA